MGGDDSIHGQTGNDALYGDGQDDDLLGEAGNDWISGGQGDDASIGDDGKIKSSRNGVAEPLYAIAATTQQTVSTPGNPAMSAVMNPTGALTKSVDIEPFDAAGDDLKEGVDTVYGGLGNDSLHGSVGNDLLSGAEALAVYFNNPAGTPSAAFDPDTSNFVGFTDAKKVQSLQKIANHPLNFDAFANGNASQKINDGNDALFGDLGNDWLVGGTNSDHLYGGLGHDIMNLDDNLETNGGLNNQPDAAAYADADTAFGGGGRDTLMGNTGTDRMLDWVGEFNAFVVPFAPFGRDTIYRDFAPNTVGFLYQLSRSDGADATRAGAGLGAAARNGEPFGELGLVIPQDANWREQTGGPDDPQAGNNGGVKKDAR